MREYLLLPLTFVAAPAFAQGTPPGDTATPPDAAIDIGGDSLETEGDEILVIATRLRGSVDAPQPPVVTLDEADIESYGAASLSDLIAAISPQTGSGRGRGDGRPVFLVNGQRISSFREIRDFPPEAIRRVEVLPEEVAQRFGYPPNQRVVNFILKDQFASRTVDGEYNVPTSGGFADTELQGSLLRIDGPRRFNLTAKLNDTSLLTEAERGLIQQPGSLPTVAGDPDPARFRSLIDDSRTMSLNGTFSTALGKENGGLLSLNGAVTRSDSRSLFGLDSVLLTGPDGASQRRTLDGALVARSRSTTVEGGVTVNKPLGSWFMTATANASHSDTRSDTENNADTSGLVAAALAGTLPLSGALPVLADAGFERARTRDSSLDTLVTIAGRPFRMPAGDASLTVRGGFDYTRSRNTGGRGDDVTLDRGDASAGFNLALPLTSRRDNVLGAIGDVGLNLSAGINHLSDFGTLTDWSVGLTWKPTDRLALQASYIVNQAAPSLNQLGNPQQSAFNVSVYDFTLGQPALVTIVNGGNPGLVKEKQRDLKISANWELPFIENSNLLVEYFRNRSTDVTQGFPLLTPAIEAAFPNRVERDDATGRIIEIRRFPITFSEVAGSRLRWGFNVSGTVGKPDPNARAGRGGGGGGGRMGGGGRRGGGMGRGGGGEGGGRGFGGRGGGNGQGRWNLSAFHTVRFTDTATIAPGVPTLDLLGGDALSAGGVPRHQIELEGGVFHKGLGLRINGTWRAPATVRTTSAAGTSQLRFGSTTLVNLRTFLNFDQKPAIVKDVPFLKGSRLSLTVDNLFASRQKVTDQTGVVPLSYQPGYRDPRGRVIGIDFRKMF